MRLKYTDSLRTEPWIFFLSALRVYEKKKYDRNFIVQFSVKSSEKMYKNVSLFFSKFYYTIYMGAIKQY